jgi:hypothetical protein
MSLVVLGTCLISTWVTVPKLLKIYLRWPIVTLRESLSSMSTAFCCYYFDDFEDLEDSDEASSLELEAEAEAEDLGII